MTEHCGKVPLNQICDKSLTHAATTSTVNGLDLCPTATLHILCLCNSNLWMGCRTLSQRSPPLLKFQVPMTRTVLFSVVLLWFISGGAAIDNGLGLRPAMG